MRDKSPQGRKDAKQGSTTTNTTPGGRARRGECWPSWTEDREQERREREAERVGSGSNDTLAKLDNGERKRVGNKVPEKGHQAEHIEKHTG